MSQASSIRHEPPYTDMQQHSFDRTGEKAAGASVAYDFGYAFSDIGLSGLSVGAWYILGAIDPLTTLGKVFVSESSMPISGSRHRTGHTVGIPFHR